MPKILSDPKKNMLEEVGRLLESGGYSAVTVRAVALGCGVGVGTVYNYFSSKEALLAAFLLENWRQCVAAVEKTAETAEGVHIVARAIHEQLTHYARNHGPIFRDQNVKGRFSGFFSQHHAMLRGQLAAPLRSFVVSDFAAEFAAEALLTWTMSGKTFDEIWPLLQKTVEN